MLGDISVLDKVYIVCGRTDMRKQIDGLCAIIEEQLKMDTNDSKRSKTRRSDFLPYVC